MKKVNSACAMLLAASCIVACDKDNNDAPGASGKAKMVLSLSMGANEAQVGYIVPVSESRLTGGETLPLALAHEVNESPYVETYKGWAFYVANLSYPPVIRRYARQDDGSLLPSGELALSQNNQAGLANILFLSDTKAYASLAMENKIAIFNPTTMQITGAIDLAKPEYGVNGSATPNPAGMVERDGKVFVGCFELSSPPMCSDGAYMVVIDEATDTPEKFISDQRGSGATFFGNQGMYVDEKGDIYVLCFASYGYMPGQKSGFLRIKKGQTDFDPDYFFNITDTEISGIQGGHVVLTHFMYDQNGAAYIFGNNPTYASSPIDYVNDLVIQSFKVNLYDRTVTLLD
ncbi:MAG: DUF4374 domain-containing protein, partial [Prevotellaceae bacterium]|nr:DUF4374 domain-containing protein [Prevotellaceae bacterium]